MVRLGRLNALLRRAVAEAARMQHVVVFVVQPYEDFAHRLAVRRGGNDGLGVECKTIFIQGLL